MVDEKIKSIEEIYNTIDELLISYKEIKEYASIEYSILYFSDTIIIYQKNENDYYKISMDIWYLARLIHCRLMSKKIPLRAVITFGEFIVKGNDSINNLMFFGKALIEAYEIEKKENVIGIIVSPNSYKYIDYPDFIIMHKSKTFLKREDGCLMLNPFLDSRSAYKYYESFIDIQKTHSNKGSLESKMDLSKTRPHLTMNFEVGFDDYYLMEAEVKIDILKLQFEEVQRVKWASKDEMLAMMDTGEFIPYYRNFIELLFDIRKKYGVVQNYNNSK